MHPESFTQGTRNHLPKEPGIIYPWNQEPDQSPMEPETIHSWNPEPFTHGTRNHLSNEPGTIYPMNPEPFTQGTRNHSHMEPEIIHSWNPEPFIHGTRNHLHMEQGTIYPMNPEPFTRDIWLVKLLSNGTRIINSNKFIKHEPWILYFKPSPTTPPPPLSPFLNSMKP